MENIDSVDGGKIIRPTWTLTLRVWWTLVWRGLVFGFIAGLFAGLVGGIIGGILGPSLGFEPGVLGGKLGGYFGFVAGLGVSVWILKGVLGSEYKNFKIVVVSK
jgi:hypothetical protein